MRAYLERESKLLAAADEDGSKAWCDAILEKIRSYNRMK